jgi:hypothetical protein
VSGLVLIGSRVREERDQVWRADAQSDWDFQVIAKRPERFAQADWLRAAGVEPDVYAVRRAAIGGVPKVALLAGGVEADFVIVPQRSLRLAQWAIGLGLHRRSAKLRRALQDLAVVIRPGWRFLKGAETWGGLYRQVVSEVEDPRLSDEEARSLADSFVCDLVWTRRKIERGEWIAAQRMLHRTLAETNLRLLHEVKLRRGERSFPEGRRIERVATAEEVAAVGVSARRGAEELGAEVERCAATMRELMREMVGETWRWPELRSSEESRR